MGQRQLHLGAFIFGVGHHIAAWRYPHTDTNGLLKLDFYKRFAQTAERGKFDLVFIEDIPVLPEPLARAVQYTLPVRAEPLTLLSALASVTTRIGLVGTVSTTYSEPYHVARKFASLDHLSRGRAAWNAVTTSMENTAKNFGRDHHLDHSLRYERAKEFVDVVTGLWDSWEEDALVVDKASGIFADPAKVHALNHQGEHFSVRGPLSIHRSVQGRPVIVQAGSSTTGQAFAAQTAEVVFTAWQTLEEAQSFYASLKSQLPKYGRSEDQLKILPGILPFIGATEEEAREKEAEFQHLVLPEVGLGMVQNILRVDLTGYPLDGPLPDLPDSTEINGGKSRYQLLLDMARREQLSIRQLINRVTGARGHRTIAGTPVQIADQLEEWFVSKACDGFNIMPPYLPGGLDEFVELVIPELQRRGLFRTDYEGTTLREHLGLAKPVNRYAARAASASSVH
ncbi:LLM class flavin-dependent oxidoreductase [Paenibacillus sp. GCM10023248]|uniref:LLM class flavin-dependent oxidoreductase n=1 Tax=Bacillales TaxID=1385 RepID=UPI002378E230|nr:MULTISPECIES: LLM class flavin-dependent oxidoreductase [Bacillales]MDD9266112.1 LLM class flavin-dependent oxidoreductase [Paenibacillus sp. MAHUQ-63]MDR6878288.1 FMN-dependent oxidoreductase (nitrilotriacetate monooxygenase family) [Bacillus sp. 3255]